MCREIITQERFSTIIDSISKDALGAGFSLKGVYYSYAREKSGIYKDEPYTKPAHIQISTNEKCFRIERIDQALRFSYDPTGGFNFIPVTKPDSLLELTDYFVELEDHLQAVSSEEQATRGTEGNVDIKELRVFIRTILHRCEEHQRREVQKTTELALTAPRQYIQAHREQLARRGIERPIRRLYVIALVDAMQKIGLVAEVDWKADYATIIWQVSLVAKHFSVNIPQVRKAGTLQVSEILQQLGKHLANQGHVLATIDIDSDSYVLYIVPDAIFGKSAELAQRVGIEVSRF